MAVISNRRPPDIVVGLIALLSLPLFFYGLGNTYLWQDEAQTALLGRSVLAHGVPMVGHGAESISSIGGRDAGTHGIYFQIPWLQAYMAAASFKLFGESSWSARLPFTFAGWLCVPLVAWALRKSGASTIAARIAALLLALCVPFIICSRQARYYALAAALTLLATGTYGALTAYEKEGHEPAALLSLSFGVATTLLVLAFDLTAIGVLAALALYWALSAPTRNRWSPLFWIPWLASSLILTIWLTLSMTAASRQEHAGLTTIPGRIWHGIFFYLGQMNAHVVPVLLLLSLFICWFWARTRRIHSSHNDHPGGAVLLVAVTVGGLGGVILSPHRFFRYAVPVLPLTLGLTAVGLAAVWSLGRWGRAVAAAIVVALITTTAPFVGSHSALAALATASGWIVVRDRVREYRVPLVQLAQEFRDPPRGPIAAAVEYLRHHATADQVLVTTYGELPLKFHTNLQVYGGETGEFPSSGVKVDWIWPRHRVTIFPGERASVEWVERALREHRYQRIELKAFDRRWENREDPEEHIFTNPGPSAPPVVLYRLSNAVE